MVCAPKDPAALTAEDLEIVMTGRNPDDELTELADYISEVRAVRHPMDKGIMARRGIEF